MENSTERKAATMGIMAAIVYCFMDGYTHEQAAQDARELYLFAEKEAEGLE